MKFILKALAVMIIMPVVLTFSYASGAENNMEENRELFSSDNYIYHVGPYIREDGSVDGAYALYMYNLENNEDVILIDRFCRADVIGNKIFVIGGGFSSGYWDRILVVFDVGSTYGTRIASGIDINFSMSNSEYPIYNNRIYLGHQTDMEHYEIISFDLNGDDVRIEVEPVATSALYSYTYNDYAIIDGIRYDYKHPADNIIVTVNGAEVYFDQPPVIIDGRTLVPLRAIFEALGAEVSWDEDTQTAAAYRNGTTVTLTIGDSWIYKNGTAIYLDVPSMLINDRTLVPVRAVSEAFDCTVDWDGGSGTVIINSVNI